MSIVDVSVSVKVNKTTEKKLETYPDRIMYEVARRTFDISFSHIPKDSGRMRITSSRGVTVDGNHQFHIGSYTDYAYDVWNYNNNTTNWSEPGTFSKWYDRIWQEKGESILSSALARYKL